MLIRFAIIDQPVLGRYARKSVLYVEKLYHLERVHNFLDFLSFHITTEIPLFTNFYFFQRIFAHIYRECVCMYLFEEIFFESYFIVGVEWLILHSCKVVV